MNATAGHAGPCASSGRRPASGPFWLSLSIFCWRLALAAAPASPLDPAVTQLQAEVHGSGWIAFGARSNEKDWDLFLCRPDGTDLRPLTRTPGFNEFSPQFSRDGRKLLYRRVTREETIDNNRHGEQGELILANADGSSPIVLGQPSELPWASFSPDGFQLASLSIKGVTILELATRRVLRQLPRQGFFQQMTWSPDGKWLIGVANSFGTGWSIARMDVTNGEATAVNRVDCCTPDWFPNSREVVFSWRPPGQKANHGYGWTQLWRATSDGASRQLIYGEDGRHVYGGHVSPDGKYILFTGNMSEDGDPKNAGAPMGLARLQDTPIIGGQSKELRAAHPHTRNGPVLVLPVGWEPCWTSADVGGSPPNGVADPATVQAGDTRRSDSARLADELHGKGWLVFSAKIESTDWDLFLMRPDGADRRRITHTREFNEAGARFSPDGKRLLYYRLPQTEAVDNNTYGNFDLVIAQADGSEPVVYGPAFPWASWGPDSRHIACLALQGVQVVDLATRKVIRQFPRKGLVEQLVWSPDGKWFVGTANGLGQFWNIGLLDPTAGELRVLSETDRYNCTPDWCPDSRHVVYARGIIPQQGGRAELWMAAIDGLERRRIYAEPLQHIYGACASPKGEYILFTRSREDLGKVAEIELAIIRWPKPSDPNDANAFPRLDLGPGWEPHWTAQEILK